MSLIESLLKLINNKEKTTQIVAPEGVCPNCWGRAEYGGHFYDTVKQDHMGVSDNQKRLGWIQEYVNTHLSDILLSKSEDGEEVCQKCSVAYRSEKE